MNYQLELVHFGSTDHLTLPALLYSPHSKSKKVAIYLHGNGSSSVFYDAVEMNSFGEAFTKVGISFFTFNNRGASWFMKLNRKTEEEERVVYGMAYELIRECVMDIDGAIRYLKTLGYREFYLIGVSTGANKIAVYHRYKPKNEVAKYILLSGGDDTGLYYHMEFKNNKKKFLSALKRCVEENGNGHGRRLVPRYLIKEPPISYQSLFDTINPDGDYNIFPFYEYMNRLKLSKKPLFKEYKLLNKPTLVVYGELDEYCYGNVPRCVEILKKECPHPELFTFKIIKGADHGFHGKEKKLAELVAAWLKR